jgi:uncharacterized protein YndB with AHSA1/START domain
VTVNAVHKDVTAHTMIVSTDLDATPERVWQLWADPRQLERWWGPPSYPATFTQLELRPGGRAQYYMTGPTGDMPQAGWVIVETNPPHSIVIKDHFEAQNGVPDPSFPITTMYVTIEEIGNGKTRMSIKSEFPDLDAMEKMLGMGMEEGMTQAVGQIDAILAEKVPA